MSDQTTLPAWNETSPAPAALPSWDDTKPVEEIGTGETLGRSFLNNVPLAPQAIATGESFFGNGDYSKNLEDWNARAAAAKAANPKTYAAGATAGAIAPALVLGPEIEAAPLTTGAAIGATSAMSNTDVLKHPGEAAEEAVLGGATGAGLGKLGEMVSEAGTPLAEKAAGVRARGIGLSPKLLGRLEPEEITEYGNFAKAHDLLNSDVQGALDRATAAKEAIGKHIGDIGANATKAPQEILEQRAGELLEEADKLSGVKGAERDVRTLMDASHNLMAKGGTFGDLQDLKNFYGGKAFDASHAVKDEAMAKAYHAVKDAMLDTIDNAPEEYQGAMKEYKMANDAVSGLTKKLGAVRNGQGTPGIGFMGRILGQLPGQSNPAINLPTAAGVAALGHPMMGLMAATPSLNNPAVQAGTLDALAKLLPNIPRQSLIPIIEKISQQYGSK